MSTAPDNIPKPVAADAAHGAVSIAAASRASTPQRMAAPSAALVYPTISWQERGATHTARWRSEAGVAPPKRVVIADDTMSADRAWRLACEGTALLWRGDFQNARQLLQALGRRADHVPRKKPGAGKSAASLAPTDGAATEGAETGGAAADGNAAVDDTVLQHASASTIADAPAFPEAFHRHRMSQAQRARTLGMLLLQFEPDHQIDLRRAPDVRRACMQAYGPDAGTPQRYAASLRELLGLISAREWRKKGVEVAALDERIHPHYGVFAPVRSEYVNLVNDAPLMATDIAWDIGTGTGVLAAVLARRGVKRVVATDQDQRALDCARDNLKRLGLNGRVEVIDADLFPPVTAAPPGKQMPSPGLIVCNPPWLPGRPSAPLERAVYDFESRMVRGFLAGVGVRLAPQGEAWLILSDLAEHLGLRTREELLKWIAAGGLKVQGRLDAKPVHPKVSDATDPLHAARRAETTSLWRLARQ